MRNLGETDAGAVAVNFYKERTQRDTTLLGDVILEGVPAGATAEAIYEWKVPADVARDPSAIDPSFTIALRGSLMRVSSVAAPK